LRQGQPRLILNSPCSPGWPQTQSYCLSLLSAGITGVYHTHILEQVGTQARLVWGKGLQGRFQGWLLEPG
jgi:hypothetical protein